MARYGTRKRMLVHKNEVNNALRDKNKSIDLDEELIKFTSIFEIDKTDKKYG